MGTGAKVVVSYQKLPQGAKPPSRESSAARVRLKLYALAYVESRHGVDASPAMCWDALFLFCQSAINYVAALEGKPKLDLVDRTINDDRGPSNTRTMTSDSVAAARTELKLAAIGYEASRRGADSYTQGSQFGMQQLCEAAIRYVERLEGGSDRSDLKSRMRLED